MSFANDVRNELARIVPDKECCKRAELSALLLTSARICRRPGGVYDLEAAVEKAATARKIFKLLKSQNLQASVRMEKRRRFAKTRVYLVNTAIENETDFSKVQSILSLDSPNLKPRVNRGLLSKVCCRKAYLRGLFLNRGFINRPEGEYHLELVVNDAKMAAEAQKIMARFKIPAKEGERKGRLLLYIKESEKIVDFLRVVGASAALLEFENVRIIKSMRNIVNRQVNCETANLAKTIDAAVRQNELIKKLIVLDGWEGMPSQLIELAQLRMDYPDHALSELGTMLKPPLSKSGVAYRMRKLEEHAKQRLQNQMEQD